MFMMNQKELIESNKECAQMLGLSLKDYKRVCKTVKVPTSHENSPEAGSSNFLKKLGINNQILK